MKIVSLEEWMILPIGTVYAEWTPCTTLGDWAVKGSTGAEDIALYEASLIDSYDIYDAAEGATVTLDKGFRWSRATGCYYGLNCQKQPHQFLVLSQSDLTTIINKVTMCRDYPEQVIK